MIYHDDVLSRLEKLKAAGKTYDLIFADPPYRLSGREPVRLGDRVISGGKGDWDKPREWHIEFDFTRSWLSLCRDILNPMGTVWVSGTQHNIHIVGMAMQALDFRILNDIAWFKPASPPNMACRFFTHSHETLIWARPHLKGHHRFNYRFIKALNGNRQMRSVWIIPAPGKSEKKHGRHPTQKPLALLELIILSSTIVGDRVLDLFCGSGTAVVAAERLGRTGHGIEENYEFVRLAEARLNAEILGEREPAFYKRFEQYVAAEVACGVRGIVPRCEGTLGLFLKES